MLVTRHRASFRNWALCLTAIGFCASLCSAQEPSCDSEPCVNPVPCSQCIGSWTDDWGGTWTLTSNASNQVSGTVYVELEQFNSNCYNQSYTVSGSITPTYGTGASNGYMAINITASDPYPGSSPGCVVATSVNLTGNVQNNGCDLIPGDATLSSSIDTESTSFEKNPDQPSGETDAFRAWDTDFPTIGQWQGNLTTTNSLNGRQVSEVQGGSSTDTCWFSGSAYDQAGLSGGWWNVGFYFNSAWNDDYVGWLPDAVTYYRANTTIPCQATIPQDMYIAIEGTSGSTSNYFNGSIEWWIGATQVGSGKQGSLQTVTWP